MKFNLSILAILLSAFLNANGQTTENIKQLQQRILSADSIVLISHLLTVEFAPKIVHDYDITKTKKSKINRDPFYPKFLKDGKINPAIIKQRKVISKSETTKLYEILKFEKVTETNSARCDWPHHTIIIYKNNVQSYIDICFSCKRINTSKNIDLTTVDFTENKWKKLKAFFNKHGLTYQLLNFNPP